MKTWNLLINTKCGSMRNFDKHYLDLDGDKYIIPTSDIVGLMLCEPEQEQKP